MSYIAPPLIVDIYTAPLPYSRCPIQLPSLIVDVLWLKWGTDQCVEKKSLSVIIAKGLHILTFRLLEFSPVQKRWLGIKHWHRLQEQPNSFYSSPTCQQNKKKYTNNIFVTHFQEFKFELPWVALRAYTGKTLVKKKRKKKLLYFYKSTSTVVTSSNYGRDSKTNFFISNAIKWSS